MRPRRVHKTSKRRFPPDPPAAGSHGGRRLSAPSGVRGKDDVSRQTIGHHMSSVPHLIQRDETLSAAHQAMREHRIRHLPVLDGRRLVGIVSDRDLHLVETLRDVDPRAVRVDEAMTREPFTVGPRTSLASVARSMSKAKYGSAIVLDRGRIIGIFTTTDALDALVSLSESQGSPRLRARRAARPHRHPHGRK